MQDHLLLDDGFSEKKLDNNADIADANKVRLEINEHTKAISRGRYAIVAALIFLTIGTVVELVTMPELMAYSIGGLIVIGGLFGIALYLMSNKKAVEGLSLGLAIYLGFQLLIIIGEPSSIASGLIVKGFIIYFLIAGIANARALPKKVDELKGISMSKEDHDKIYKYQPLSKLFYIKPDQQQQVQG